MTKVSLCHHFYDMLHWLVVYVVEARLTWGRPTQYDTFSRYSSHVVQRDLFVGRRNVFDHFQRHCPIVLRQPVLRNGQIQEVYLTYIISCLLQQLEA